VLPTVSLLEPTGDVQVAAERGAESPKDWNTLPPIPVPVSIVSVTVVESVEALPAAPLLLLASTLLLVLPDAAQLVAK
jgi:hypothetical protein